MDIPRHPDHNAVSSTVRNWFTESYPAMGFLRERRRFGVYGQSVYLDFMSGGVLLEALTRDEVPEFIEDARRYFDGGSVGISVDDPRRDAEIGPALVAAGFERGSAWSHLAHVGPIPAAPPVAGLTIEALAAGNLDEFSVAKLKGFANDEAEPSVERLAHEIVFHRVVMTGDERGLLARIEREPAAVLGYYEGTDRHVSILSTRLPFRGRGIARQLLRHQLLDAHARGCRSVVIGADQDDTPIQLYHRLGFTDEVYWNRGYHLPGIEGREIQLTVGVEVARWPGSPEYDHPAGRPSRRYRPRRRCRFSR
jgi:GNAT superfamily N-acetyltransferase